MKGFCCFCGSTFEWALFVGRTEAGWKCPACLGRCWTWERGARVYSGKVGDRGVWGKDDRVEDGLLYVAPGGEVSG